MLQKVSIQNFKSLKDVTLELQKVNLLIGPNNSGKSNFLKALEFVSVRVVTFKDEDISSYFYNFQDNSPINVIFYIKNLQNEQQYKFMFTHDSNEPKGVGGNVYIDDNTKKEHFDANHIFPLNSETFWKNKKFYGDEPWNYSLHNISNLILYKLNPDLLTKPYPILIDNKFIKEDGSNIIAFLDNMQDECPEVINSINKDLNKCLPEFSGIRLLGISLSENNELRKLYGDKTFKKLGLFNIKLKIIYWSDLLSEGVLYFLALLCIVHQPKLEIRLETHHIP